MTVSREEKENLNLKLEESEKWFYTKKLIERRSIKKDIERKVDNRYRKKNEKLLLQFGKASAFPYI